MVKEGRDPWRYVALKVLLEAYSRAEELQCSPWEEAVKMRALRAAGIGNRVLRDLMEEGVIEAGAQTAQKTKAPQTSRSSGDAPFSERTCFVLTKTGLAVARLENMRWQGTHQGGKETGGEGTTVWSREVPKWDGELRELRLGEWVVKRFNQPAPDQEAIFASFEEEGWPRHMDDPLPPREGQDAKERLHGAIKRLNRGQKPRLIRFMGDGQGTGIRWEVV
jgi:hypothetical protein